MQMPTFSRSILQYLTQPARLFRTYDRANLRPDLIAGITVAVILLPQAIAFALIAELPPEMGLYGAIVGAVIGALWGSSDQVHTGPTNAISLLVLSALGTVAAFDDASLVVAAGVMAVMIGVLQLVLGLARLGVLINFVSHSVVVGFATGAGVLIGIKQFKPLLGAEFESEHIYETLYQLVINLPRAHVPTVALGVGTIILIIVLRRINPSLPGALISMVITTAVVMVLNLDEQGVSVIGQLPRGFPPLAPLPLFNIDVIAELSTGALAVAAIGLVETSAISRSMAAQTGQRLDSNQEFVGQGLANIASGLFSGYAVAGSFSRSAVNFKVGAQSRMAAIFSSIFVLIAMFALAPLAAFLPVASLAGVLIVTAYGMIDRAEIRRIWQGARYDAIIMAVTFFGTLFLEIEFAVLLGILLSFAFYVMKSSVPRVEAVLPDATFKHFLHQPEMPGCPQLGIINISGDLYFGAVNHVEEAIIDHLEHNPAQRHLMLRMHQVNQVDFSGIHMLEVVLRHCRERGGDLYLVRVSEPVRHLMETTAFDRQLGIDHFLDEDQAISYLFHKVLDPAVCIYECPVRAFRECQNLPKRDYALALPVLQGLNESKVPLMEPAVLWKALHDGVALHVIDVREPREFRRSHVPQAQLVSLQHILADSAEIPSHAPIVLVCQSGRRSARAADVLTQRGVGNISIMRGGMQAWEAAALLAAVEPEIRRTQP
jgi:SulP family sulfate permease